MKKAIAGILALCSITLQSCTSVSATWDKAKNQKVVAALAPGSRTDGSLIKAFQVSNVIIIREGTGGEVEGMIRTLAFLDQHPEKIIVIDGECASACTLLLTKPKNVVFTENANFRFHSAYMETADGTFMGLSSTGNERMMSKFPPEIQDWIVQNNAFASVQLTDMVALTAREFAPTMFVESSKLTMNRSTRVIEFDPETN